MLAVYNVSIPMMVVIEKLKVKLVVLLLRPLRRKRGSEIGCTSFKASKKKERHTFSYGANLIFEKCVWF